MYLQCNPTLNSPLLRWRINFILALTYTQSDHHPSKCRWYTRPQNSILRHVLASRRLVFPGRVVSPVSNPQPGGPGVVKTNPAWLNLPGAKTPARIALGVASQVTGVIIKIFEKNPSKVPKSNFVGVV